MARKKEEVQEKNKKQVVQNASGKQQSSAVVSSFKRVGRAVNRSNEYLQLQENRQHFLCFREQLAALNLQIREIPGDGNCLFRSLGDQLEGHCRNHLKHRHDIVQFIREHRLDFEPFVEDDISFDRHVDLLAQPGTYAGQDAIVAFSRLHHVAVVIHQLGLAVWHVAGPVEGHQLHLSYHNHEHYSSVRRLNDNSELPASVWLKVSSASTSSTSSHCDVVAASGSNKKQPGCEPSDTTSSFAAIVDVNSSGNNCNSVDHQSAYFATVDELIDDDFEDDLQYIMALSGCQNADMALRALQMCNYDSAMAIQQLVEMDQMLSAAVANTADTDAAAHVNQIVVPRVSLKQPSLTPARPLSQKLSKRDRKDQRRRERVIRAQQRIKEAAGVTVSDDEQQRQREPPISVVNRSIACLSL